MAIVMAEILFVLALIPFYFLGVFPSGYIIAKLHSVEIEKCGSGNVGATNVARVLGSRAGVLTLLLDILKGFLAPLIATAISGNTNFAVAASAAAIAGHCFSIPKKLPHGKGVATTAGVFLYLSPLSVVIATIIFAAIMVWQKIVSLASVSAALALPIIIMLRKEENPVILLAIAAATLIFYRHKDNINRFINGKEDKFKVKRP